MYYLSFLDSRHLINPWYLQTFLNVWKESVNSDGRRSHQYQRIDQSPPILNYLAYKRLRQMTLKIHVLDWSRNTHVVELSLLIGSYPSTSPFYKSLGNLIKLYTYIFIYLFENFCNKIQHKHTTFDCLLLYTSGILRCIYIVSHCHVQGSSIFTITLLSVNHSSHSAWYIIPSLYRVIIILSQSYSTQSTTPLLSLCISFHSIQYIILSLYHVIILLYSTAILTGI
jgi:hypothetical protein